MWEETPIINKLREFRTNVIPWKYFLPQPYTKK